MKRGEARSRGTTRRLAEKEEDDDDGGGAYKGGDLSSVVTG